ncbi:DNA/RNA nuclease SfsA [Desulfonatronovibrio hydrogenovorans]|uniref:DNA/RNA nuclease SfsA n=1 Tax=Desulfonatronovibrio hydrogenovorans TaxID=53245 RepID=UPI000A8A0671|nr:DNA/RNA nuclease SfsA [Desulfonatronovibrio hydrogenovorans]
MNPKKIMFPQNRALASFDKREKRFIIKARIGQDPILVHTNNSGSMLGLLRPGRQILVSKSDNPKRKLPYTLELVREDGFWVGVNTLTPNRMLKLAWEHSLIPELTGFKHYRSEAVAGQSRLDALLEGDSGRLWVEAKNVTLVEDQRACFPDAVSQRASKHMAELISLARAGHRIACFYLIQRPDCSCFGPADFIDPQFSRMFKKAADSGLEILAYKTDIDETGISLGQRLPISWT